MSTVHDIALLPSGAAETVARTEEEDTAVPPALLAFFSQLQAAGLSFPVAD